MSGFNIWASPILQGRPPKTYRIRDFPRSLPKIVTLGDIGRSIPLPDGRVLWIFGDVAYPGVGFINIYGAIQKGYNLDLTPVHSDNSELVPRTPTTFFWPGDGQVVGDEIHLWCSERQRGNPDNLIGTRIGVLDLNTLAFKRYDTPPVPTDPKLSWTCVEGIYRYGSRPRGGFLGHEWFLARDISGVWSYRTATGWSSDPTEAVPVITDSDATIDVALINGTWRLVKKFRGMMSPDIHEYTAPNPWGPWGNETLLMSVPDFTHYPAATGQGAGAFVYSGLPHRWMNLSDGGLAIGYSTNGIGSSEYGMRLASTADLPELPVISNQTSTPHTIVNANGGELSVTASGKGPFSYQWESDVFGDFFPMGGLTNPSRIGPTLSFGPGEITLGASGRRYRCRVTNRFGHRWSVPITVEVI